MSTSNIKLVLAVALAGIVAGAVVLDHSRIIKAQDQLVVQHMAEAHMQPAAPALAQIPVTFTSTVPQRQFYNGRNSSFENLQAIERWSLLETQDVVLINNDIAGAQTCPEALGAFMTSFADRKMGSLQHVSHGIPSRAIRDIATRMQGKTVSVNVRIPLFNGRPAGLENCLDFNWEASSHRLSYRGKPVAVMVAEQRQLGLVSADK